MNGAIGGEGTIAREELSRHFLCTVCGITGASAKDNHIFFGQTMDNPFWPTRHVIFVVQPEDGYKYIGTTADIWGFSTGLNEKGFGLGSASASIEEDEPLDPRGDVNTFKFGPMLLSRCENVREAIEMIKGFKIGAPFFNRNLIMGDATGELVLVEVGSKHLVVETITNNGYVVRTNHWVSRIPEYPEQVCRQEQWSDPYVRWNLTCDRLERGRQWFETKLGNCKDGIAIEDIMYDLFPFLYIPMLGQTDWGPTACFLVEPKTLTYWFTYGWPGGNLPPDELENRQICQNLTWGIWLPFRLSELIPGQYTTELGQLMPLSIQYLYSHFCSNQQRSPSWLNYQSDDPMKLWYRPPKDISPDPMRVQKNPYGPGGYVGTWTMDEGYKALQVKEGEEMTIDLKARLGFFRERAKEKQKLS